MVSPDTRNMKNGKTAKIVLILLATPAAVWAAWISAGGDPMLGSSPEWRAFGLAVVLAGFAAAGAYATIKQAISRYREEQRIKKTEREKRSPSSR